VAAAAADDDNWSLLAYNWTYFRRSVKRGVVDRPELNITPPIRPRCPPVVGLFRRADVYGRGA